MSLYRKNFKGFGRVITTALVAAGLASGCSTTSDAGTVSAFLIDFAREALAAWLL